MRLQILAILSIASGLAHADDKPKHPEQWMFDSHPITATSPSAGAAEASIQGTLYARVFYDRPIKDVFSLTSTHYQLRVFQQLTDTGSSDMAAIWIAPKDLDKTWLDIEIFPDPKTAHTKYGAYGETFYKLWAEHDSLKGKHVVRYEIIVGGENGEAPARLPDADQRASQITIDFTGFDAKKLAATGLQVAAAGDRAFAANLSLPKRGAMHTAALAKQAEAMTRKVDPSIAKVKVIFTGTEWGLSRDDVTSRILSRQAVASAVVRHKDGTCMVEPGVIEQPYVHGKFVAPGSWLTTSATPYQVDCAKAFP